MEILGIDIGGSGIKGAPVDTEKGELLEDRFRIPTPQPATPENVTETVGKIAEKFQWRGSIGCGFPSVIQNGSAKTAANIDDKWIDKNVVDLLRKETKCKVNVLNDVDAAGWAVMEFGVGKGHTGTVLIVAVGTGIGTAIFSGGALLPNTEFGHIIMNGKKAEHFASNLIRKSEKLSWKEWGDRLNNFLNYMEELIWPDLIVLGGGVVKYHEEFMPLLNTSCEVLPSRHLNNAGIIGAALSAKLAFH